MSITPNPEANYTPPMKGYSGQGAFRFWCQTVLPIVYDDSLSYYELLNKMVIYLNNTIADVAAVEDNVQALYTAYNSLQDYVNTYFTNLDIQAEINVKLDEMATSGALDALLEPFVTAQIPEVVAAQIDDVVAEQIDGSVSEQIGDVVAEQIDTAVAPAVTTWLNTYVDPVGSAVVVDSSLSVSGAAADAKITGEKVNSIENTLIDGNAYDVTAFLAHPDTTNREVEFAWNEAKTECAVEGTASGGLATCTMFINATAFPKGMKAGGTYRAIYYAENVRLQVYCYDNGTLVDEALISVLSDREFTIPADASGLMIRLAVGEGVTADESVSPKIYTNALTNDELNTKIDNLKIFNIEGTYEYVSKSASEVTTGLTNKVNSINDWLTMSYIDEETGEIKETTQTPSSVGEKFIVIPNGLTLHVHGATKIGKYNSDGSVISVDSNPPIDYSVDYSEAKYVRIQRMSVDPSVLANYVSYYYTVTPIQSQLDEKINVAYNAVQDNAISISTTVGNPLVLTDCDERSAFGKFVVADNSGGENIVICKKNIFAIRHANGTFIKNNVKFQFNTINNTIRIYTEAGQSASASATSGFTDFGYEFSKVNGTTFNYNFKFKFIENTRVAVNDNPNQDVPFNFGVQMRVYDGTNIINVGTGGVAFDAIANTEYVVYFLVQEGWSGDITYSPQVEINAYPTEYEVFTGIYTPLTATGSNNIFECGNISTAKYSGLSGKINALFNGEDNSIVINANNDTDSGAIIYDNTKDGTVNSQAWYYIDKFVVGRKATSLSDLVANGGKYTLTADDFESGQWSYSTKSANNTRGRTKQLIPVHAGEKIYYSNSTYDTLFGVLATTTSSSYAQAFGWRTDGIGVLPIEVDGYLTCVIRNHANTSAVVDVATYNSVVTIMPENTPVYVKLFDKKYAKILYGMLYDGESTRLDYTGDGLFLNAEAGTEYGVRIGVRDNAKVNCIVYPKISTGVYALKDYGTFSGCTTIFSDKSAEFSVKQHRTTTKVKANDSNIITNNIITLTGGHIATPFGNLRKRKPMVSFIDDDTTNATFVQRYHDIFANKNVLGGYAVETKNLDDNSGLADMLLGYEQEGFACLYHAYYQSGDATRYWISTDPSYDEDLIKENFMRGLRSMREYGFSNYKYWVTPYGVNDKFIVDLAKNHGMECLLNCPSIYAQEGFITPYGNVSRWNIPRVIFGNYTNNDTWLHRAILGAKEANGWVIIVSHVNSWGDNVATMTSRLNDLIDYCVDEGLEIVPFPVAYEEYRAAFLMQELF